MVVRSLASREGHPGPPRPPEGTTLRHTFDSARSRPGRPPRRHGRRQQQALARSSCGAEERPRPEPPARGVRARPRRRRSAAGGRPADPRGGRYGAGSAAIGQTPGRAARIACARRCRCGVGRCDPARSRRVRAAGTKRRQAAGGAPRRRAAAAAPTRRRGRDYVGEPACTACHEPQTKEWRQSDHARAMDARPSSVLGLPAPPYAGTTSSFSTRGVIRQDGRPTGAARVRSHTFGTRRPALSSSWRPPAVPPDRGTRGRRGGRPALVPPTPASGSCTRTLHWTGPNQNWNYMCRIFDEPAPQL